MKMSGFKFLPLRYFMNAKNTVEFTFEIFYMYVRENADSSLSFHTI